jgi:hypothetical protein
MQEIIFCQTKWEKIIYMQKLAKQVSRDKTMHQKWTIGGTKL